MTALAHRRAVAGGVDGALLLAAAAVGAGFVLAAYALSPVVALAAVAGSVLLLWVLADPLVGIAAGLLLVPLESLTLSAGAAGFTLAEFLFFASAASAALRMAIAPLPRRFAAVHVAFAALIAAAATGMFFAQDIAVVRKVVLAWALFLVLSVYVSRAQERHVRRIVAVIVASCTILAIFAVAGAGEISLRAGGTEATNRATGAFNHPNLLALYLGLGLPLAMVSAVESRRVWRIIAVVASLCIVVALLLTLSRAATIGAAVAVSVLLAWPSFRRAVVVAAVVVLVTAPIGLSPLLASREADIIRTRLSTIQVESGTNPRLRIYEQVPEMIADRPLLGVGVGNFLAWSPLYGMRDKGGAPFEHAHNVALTVAAEAGLIGLAALIAFVWGLVATSAGVVRARASPLHGVGVALVAALAGIAVVSLTDYPLRSNPVMALLMIEVGLLLAVASLARRGTSGTAG